MKARSIKRLSPAGLALTALVGCQTWQPDYNLVAQVEEGQHALASEAALETLPTGPDAREDVGYGLASIRLGMTQLADGQVEAAELPLLAAYEILRTQGVNDGRALMLLLQDEEDFQYWKGEPFEQAMAYAYFSAQLASVDDWYNAVVAADNAIFQLNNFEEAVGKAKDRALAKATTEEERQEIEESFGDSADPQAVFFAAESVSVQEGNTVTNSDGSTSVEPDEDAFEEFFFESGYVPEQTNFVVGYMMQGIASLAASNAAEDQAKARDAFTRAVQYNPSLEPLTRSLLNGEVNTVLWVDHGKGPEKFRYGYAEAFSKFRELMTLNSALKVALRGGVGEYTESGLRGATGEGAFPPAANLNEYALDHRWLNLQNARVAKAVFGDALIATGAVVAATSDDVEGKLIGAGIALVGFLQRQGAKADIRHIEIMPQRVYFAAMQIDQDDTTIELEVQGQPGSRLKLPGMNPPADNERLQFRYVRLNNPQSGVAPAWATSGRVVYANDRYEGSTPGDDLPFIMGGSCVRTPSSETLAYYQRSGNLTDLTLTDLENLYVAEGITWELGDQRGVAYRHVLEGGTSLIAPFTGTAGYARLFCQQHTAYVPVSEELRSYLGLDQPLIQR